MAYTVVLHLGNHDRDLMPVFIGSQSYPRLIQFRAVDDEGGPNVEIMMMLRRGIPMVSSFYLGLSASSNAAAFGDPDGREVRDDDAAYWPLSTITYNVYGRWAPHFIRDDDGTYVPGDSNSIEVPPERLANVRELKGTCPAAELWAVARAYRECADGKPVRAVLSAGRYKSYKTAARRVQQAREDWYLPPTTQGKQQV